MPVSLTLNLTYFDWFFERFCEEFEEREENSEKLKRSSLLYSSETSIEIEPLNVNFKAFCSKLIRTCLIL